MEAKTFSCKLDEKEVEYINNFYNNSFSNYVHHSIKRDLELSKKNIKSNYLQNSSQSVIMLGVGAILIFYSLSMNHMLGFIMSFLLGVFFIVNSLVTIYLKVFKKWQMTS